VWDLAGPSGKARLRATLSGHQWTVNGLAFSADGRLLATNNNPYGVQVWDLDAPGGEVRLKQALPNPGELPTFSPDGQTLATAYFSQEIRLWDLATGKQRVALALPDPSSMVRLLAYAPDGKTLAATILDGRTFVWDLQGGGEPSLLPATAARLASFPGLFRHPWSGAGVAVSVRHPETGRTLAPLLPLEAPAGEGPEGQVLTPREPAPEFRAAPDWFAATPEGYCDGSPVALARVRWNLDGTLQPAERYLRRFHRSDMLQKSLRGDPLS